MRSDSCDQKMSVKTTMFYIHSADSIIKFHTYQKSLVSYFFYMRKLLKLSCKVIANLLCISSQISVQKLIHLSQCSCTAYRMSAECSSMGTCCESFCNLCCCTDGTDWHSTAQSLCHRYDIRFDTIIHIGHNSTCSAPSCLYFIDQKKHIVLITEFTKSLHEFHCCRMYATLALYRLNHNGNCVLCTCILESLKVIVRCIGETISHRSESNLASIPRLTCCRHGTKGSSMESHLCSYDMITVWTILFNTIFTGHFDHCLVSLCTRVLIENLVHSDCFTDLLSKQRLRDCVWIVECMHNII